MSEGIRSWPAMLVAAILVLSIAAVMFIGAENEPSGPFGPMRPEHGQVTYDLTSDELGFSGSRVYDYSIMGWGIITSTVNSTGELPPIFSFGLDLPVIFGTGFLLDITMIDTAWGDKAVERYINQAYLRDGLGITVCYSGVETDVLYRMDVIGMDFRLTCLLSDTNFTEINDMDPAERYHPDVLVSTFAISEGGPILGSQGGIVQAVWEPAEGKDLRFELNMTEYSFVLINESMIWTMLDGGCFLYDQQRSLVGNGTLDFTVEEGWFFWYLVQTYNGDGSGWVKITAHDE